MRPLVTAEEMREHDRKTIEELGVSGAVLMEHAGSAVADEVATIAAPGAEVAILCGSGNNGGDGYVAARWLREAGRHARVYLCAGRPKPGGDAALHLAAWERLGGEVVEVPDAVALAGVGREIQQAAVVVDALLGTGLKKPVEGHLADVIKLVNSARGVKLAVDVPSGLDADSGRELGVAVRADRTVTFGFAKIGLVSSPGFERAGVLRVADIGIPAELADGARVVMAEDADIAALLPPRPRGGHKGTFGHVLVVAGSPGKSGAAILATLGALRGGAGLVTLASDDATRAAAQVAVPEAMVTADDILTAARGKKAVAIGPGMPTGDDARAHLAAVLRALDVPVVLDADALNHAAADATILAQARAPLVLTPHPGEAARLLGSSTEAIQDDRVASATRLAAQAGAIVVLKGARTVVAHPNGQAAIVTTGNPGMGTGGTGDVLCGLTAALLAQGIPPFDAALAAAYVHGRAGDLVAARQGERGMIASDVAHALPLAFQSLSR